MLWLMLVGGAFLAVVMLVNTVMEIFDGCGELWYCLIRFVISCVIVAIGLFGLVGIYSLSYEEVEQTKELKLVSIADNSEISGNGSGSLFYVRAYVNTNEVYSFYYEVENGGIKRGKVAAGDTIIYEQDNCSPYIVETTIYTKNKMGKVLRVILAFGYGTDVEKTYEIYIPKGSIYRDYNLDGE